MIKLLSAMAAFALVAGTPAIAQEAGSRQSRDFVEAAAQSDAFEILEARTVLAESRDPQVRAFATRMIQDHEASSARLRAAAQHAGLTPPPPQIGADQAPLLSGLQGLRGSDFDRTYARQQALAHQSALTVQQQYAASGDEPSLRQIATSTVPMISAHLAMAEQLRAQLGAR